ncbi:unnamed protein product, partial [marine sediment metagenome]
HVTYCSSNGGNFYDFANKITAEYLLKHYPENTILRVHQQTTQDQDNDKDQDQDLTATELFKNVNSNTNPKLNRHLQIISMKSAEYKLANGTETPYHWGLGLKYYTHFTSPIRRYVDLVNHRLIKETLLSATLLSATHLSATRLSATRLSATRLSETEERYTNISQILGKINGLNKRINKAEREFKFLELVSKLERKSMDKPIETMGYITSFNIPHVTLYLPKWDLSYNVLLIHPKISDLITVTNVLEKITMINKKTQSNVSFHLLEQLDILVIPNFQAERMNKKLKIEINKVKNV